MSGLLSQRSGQGIYAPWDRRYGLQGEAKIVHRPSSALPQTAQEAIFEILGGPVRILQLAGRLLEDCDATVTNLTVVADLDSGVADVNLCTATAIASLGAGTLFALSGAGIGVALQKAGAVSGLNQPIGMDIGAIDLLTNEDQATALADWFLMYEPLFPGAAARPDLVGGRGLAVYDRQPRSALRRAAEVLPATAQDAIFRVVGGPVLIWGIVGKVTTAMSGTATNLTLVANPTSGLTDVNLCTATAVASTAAGTLLSLGVAGIGTALQKGGAVATLLTPIIADIGTIDLLTNATNTGAVEWEVLWEPLHPAGRVQIA